MFSISCSIVGLHANQYVQFVRLIEQVDFVISNGSVISERARNTGRYSVTMETVDNNTMVSVLDIAGKIIPLGYQLLIVKHPIHIVTVSHIGPLYNNVGAVSFISQRLSRHIEAVVFSPS
jgi:hypothetical protein